MAFSAPTPNVDPVMEDKIADAYMHDPGASMDGVYMNASQVFFPVCETLEKSM